MILKDLQEKRSKLLADAKALLAGETVTVEQRSKFDAMLTDVTAVDGDIARLEAVEKYNTEQRAIVPARPNPGESADPAERVEVRDARQKDALKRYLQTGVESRDLTSSTLGGVVVPVGFQPQIIEAKKSYGQILEIVNLVETDHGNPIKMVQDDDTANSLAAVTVGTDATETDPTLTGLTLQVDNLTTGVVRIDRGLLSDSGFDVDAFVKDKFMKRYYRGTSNLIVAGNGGNIASLATAYATGYTSVGTVGAPCYADFAAAVGLLDPAYQMDSVWAMNNVTLGKVIGLVDGNSRPLFLPYNDGTASGFVGSILGRPVKLVTQLPNTTTGAKSILFGDFKSGYTFRTQKPGIAIFRMDERYLPGFEVGFVGFVRAGGIATPAGQSPVISIIGK